MVVLHRVEHLPTAAVRLQQPRRAQQPQMVRDQEAEMPSRSAISPTAAGASRQARMIFSRVGSLINRNISANSTTWSSPILTRPRMPSALLLATRTRATVQARDPLLDTDAARAHLLIHSKQLKNKGHLNN
ncbi:hypothetical protein ACFQU2_23990 [Siccirubricoccus deserti]